jgi:hypothetical protein
MKIVEKGHRFRQSSPLGLKIDETPSTLTTTGSPHPSESGTRVYKHHAKAHGCQRVKGHDERPLQDSCSGSHVRSTAQELDEAKKTASIEISRILRKFLVVGVTV